MRRTTIGERSLGRPRRRSPSGSPAISKSSSCAKVPIPSPHFSPNPVPAAVALEALNIYDERDIVGAVRRVGPRMQAGIRSYADHPLVGDARGVGLIGAVEVVRDKATKQSFDPKAGVAAYLVRRAQHHGAILRNMPGDIVAFSPPLIISEAEIDELMVCFGKALDDTWLMVRDRNLM